MRIFCFGSDYPPTGGGISTHTREWLLALAQEKGIKVRATIFGNREPRTEKVGGIIELTTLRSSNFFYIGWRILSDVIRYRHYEVLHAFNLFPVGFWTVFWARVFGKKSVLSFYGQDACDKRTSRKVVWLQRWALRNATWCVTISQFTKDKVIDRYKLSPMNIHVIHPIVPQLEKSNTDRKNDDFVVVSVSRLVKRKGIEYLIEAISKISDKKVRLLIVGGGPERDYLEKQASVFGVNDRVTFAGRVPELAPYYAQADIVALVSYFIPEDGDFEGLGLVLLEAQSYAKPVIGTKSGGIPEAFNNGKTGILVSERNAEAIAQAILKLKNDKNLYEEMSNATGEFLEREFGKRATVGRYLELIK
jgi:phosphatidylinositol alpha-1,6-mannosyltransferase